MMQNTQQRNQIIAVGVVVIAVVIAVIAIAVSTNSANTANAVKIDYAGIPQSRQEDGGFVLGKADAPVTIIEFADYRCPHCQDYEPTMKRFIDEFVKTGQSKYEFRIFATAGGQMTVFMGQLVDCLDQQKPGAFWEAKDLLFAEAVNSYDQGTARSVTQKLGLDYAKALSCTANSDRVQKDMSLGDRVGIQGTPAILVRYGDESPQFVTFEGQVYSRANVPFEVLAQVVRQANNKS
jgi:protein-disulfide isomerase